VDARAFEARGDGLHDDTGSLQHAIDSLGEPGGTVFVPDGVYMIDALRGVELRSDVTLRLASGARLRAWPTATEEYAVVKAENVARAYVVGGWIQGERGGHFGTAGQWGFGIMVRNAYDVVIEDVKVTDCWGDGIYIGGTLTRNVTVRRCTLDRNRRQGISITGLVGGLIEDCVLSNTHGHAPESGIDLEAPRPVRDVTIRNCLSTGNRGYGILLYDSGVTGNRLLGNRCLENGQEGIRVGRCSGNWIEGNVCSDNGWRGITVDTDTTLLRADGNVVIANECSGNRMSGISVEAWGGGNAVGNVVRDNRSLGNGGAGIHLHGAIGAIAEDNLCLGNVSAGIQTTGGASLELRGNRCDQNGVGIQLLGTDGSRLVANLCRENGRQGVHLDRGRNNQLITNEVTGNSQLVRATFDNVLIERGASSNLLQGNVCRARAGAPTARYGVCVGSADCEANVLEGNVVLSAGVVADLLDRGTGTILR
jgi:parallel beta-helix repeat protein